MKRGQLCETNTLVPAIDEQQVVHCEHVDTTSLLVTATRHRAALCLQSPSERASASCSANHVSSGNSSTAAPAAAR